MFKQRSNSVSQTRGIEPHKFPKGKSGNPNGRPKKLPRLDDLLSEIMGEEKDGMTAAEAILKRLRQMATQGNIKAAEMLLDRSYGKAKQPVEHTGKDGAPIEYIKLPETAKE